MDKTVEMSANELVAFFQKPAAELTKADIITFVREKGIRMIDFMYPAEDGRMKTLNFMINNFSYLETILTDSTDFIRNGLLRKFVERNISGGKGVFGITRKQAMEHYTKYALVRKNDRKLMLRDEKFRHYVKDPIISEGIRLDLPKRDAKMADGLIDVVLIEDGDDRVI